MSGLLNHTHSFTWTSPGTAESRCPPEAACASCGLPYAAVVASPEARRIVNQQRDAKWLALLREHWLAGIDCIEERSVDVARCACSRVDLGWQPSVGEARDSWLAHVAALLDAGGGAC